MSIYRLIQTLDDGGFCSCHRQYWLKPHTHTLFTTTPPARVSQLHSALSSRAFYPSDEEVEGWFFGEGTQGAVMAFQASEQLAETGGEGGG